MFSLLQSASDDQTAIGMCVLTLAVAALFVFISYHLGPAGQKSRNRIREDLAGMIGNQTASGPDHAHDRAA